MGEPQNRHATQVPCLSCLSFQRGPQSDPGAIPSACCTRSMRSTHVQYMCTYSSVLCVVCSGAACALEPSIGRSGQIYSSTRGVMLLKKLQARPSCMSPLYHIHVCYTMYSCVFKGSRKQRARTCCKMLGP